jgi:hypothetical protein
MSASYKLYGELGLRKCAEVIAIIKKLKSEICAPYSLDVGEYEPGTISLALEIYDSFPGGSVLELDELVQSLGPYTLEPAVLVSTYEYEEDVLIVAATENEERETLSRHRLEQIMQLMSELTSQDRERLAAVATDTSS